MINRLPFRVSKGVEAELIQVEYSNRTISIADKQIRYQDYSSGRQMAVRVLKKGREGIFTGSKYLPSSIKNLYGQALQMARFLPEDPHRQMAVPRGPHPISMKVDPKLFSRKNSEWTQFLFQLEEQILKIDSRIKKVVRLEVRESLQVGKFLNSHSVHFESRKSSTRLLLEVAAAYQDQFEVCWGARTCRYSSDLNPEELALEVGTHAAQSLGGRPIPSSKISVLFHPRVGVQILDLLSEALSADAIQMGKSFLKGCLNKKVASSVVNLIDDPSLPHGVSSTEWDDEGSPTQKVNLMEKGVLKDFLFDLRTASKAGRRTNGHGMKSNLGSSPRPHPTNLFMEPGSATLADLLSLESQVFYLWDVMGLHMADLITGEFSLGAAGFLYENGTMQHPVRGVTIAGRLLDVMSKIIEVGKNVSWFGDRGVPPFLVSQLMVSGS